MKKKFLFIVLIILSFLFNLCLVKADDEPNSKKYLYIEGANEYYFILNKGNCVDSELSSSVKKCIITDYRVKNASGNILEHEDVGDIEFYPSFNEVAFRNPNAWWGTLYVCKIFENQGIFNLLQINQDIAIYTDSIINSNTEAECFTFSLERTGNETTYYSCDSYMKFTSDIDTFIKEYTTSSNAVYRQKYQRVLEQIEDSCKQVLKSADYNDGCVKNCLNYAEDKVEWDKVFYPNSDGTSGCGLSIRVVGFIQNYLLRGIRYIVPALVILLGIIDFLRALATDKEDGMKKAQGRFVKRLIAAALIFLVPYILEFIIEKMEFVPEGCGIIEL